MKLTENFTLEELTYSATAKRLGIDNTPSEVVVSKLKTLCKTVLQPIRKKYGKSIVVTCGYRCPKLNKIVGGASTSDHIYGNAADIRSMSDTKADNKALFDLIVKMMVNREIQVKQIINEYGYDWIHVSYQDGRTTKKNEGLEAFRDKNGKTVYRRISVLPGK